MRNDKAELTEDELEKVSGGILIALEPPPDPDRAGLPPGPPVKIGFEPTKIAEPPGPPTKIG